MATRNPSPETPVFSSVEQVLDVQVLPTGAFTILIDGHPVDFEYDDRGYDTTVVLLHPAISSKVVKLPVFIGRGITQNSKVNRLFIADPTLNLYPNLQTGWFAGSQQQPNLQEELVRVFQKFTADKRTIYFGLSAGGFAALFFSSAHPGSLALPVNPQVHLADHSSPRVRQWTNSAWGLNNNSDIGEKEMPNVTTDLREIYTHPLGTRVVYIQNTGDLDHVENHWKHFKATARPQALAGVALVHAGEGHIAPSEKYLTAAIDLIVDSDTWGRIDMSKIAVSPQRILKTNK